MSDNSRLKRFGYLLLDPESVIAVTPINSGTDQTLVYGFRILTIGGSLEATDPESIAEVESYFYNQDSASLVFAPTQ